MAYLKSFRWAAPVVFVFIILCIRAPQTFTAPQFWAEDGAIFLRDAVMQGAPSIFNLHAGTLHLFARLVAFLALPFQAGSYQALFAAGAVIALLWSVASVASSEMPYAPLMAAMLILVPTDGIIFGSLTHVQWVMAPGMAIVASTPSPKGSIARFNQGLFAIMAGLTGPLSALVLPAVAVRTFFARDRHSFFLLFLITACASIQLYMSFRYYGPFQGQTHFLHIVVTIADRWFGGLANGERTKNLTGAALAFFMAAVTVLPLLLTARRIMLINLGLCVGAMLLAGVVRFAPGLSGYFDYMGSGARYFYLPCLLSIWAIAILIIEGAAYMRVAGVVAAVLICWHFYQWKRTYFPPLPWRSLAWKIDQGEAVKIPIHPAHWVVDIPAH